MRIFQEYAPPEYKKTSLYLLWSLFLGESVIESRDLAVTVLERSDVFRVKTWARLDRVRWFSLSRPNQTKQNAKQKLKILAKHL